MASLSERTRNNVRAGIFVTVAMALAFTVIVMLTEAWSWAERTHHYKLRCPVSAGVDGLGPGAEVRVGGVPMGKVTSIEPELSSGRFDTILVEFTLDRDITLYDNAVAMRIAPLLGNVAWLNIPDVGGGEGAKALQPGATFDIAPGLGMLTTLLGPENAANAEKIVGNVTQLSDFLAAVPQEYRERFVPILEKATEAMTDSAATVREVRADYAKWSDSVDRIFERAVGITETLDGMMTKADATVAEVQSLVKDNRSDIDRFIDSMAAAGENTQVVTGRIREETMDKVTALLDRGQEGVDSFVKSAETIRGRLEAELPGLADALANARLASQQIKLTTIELRRSPWKLLYRPSTEELEHELLYEAARSFAVAVSDLKAASASMDRVLTNSGQRLGDDAVTLDQVTRNLTQSFAKYEKAQQQLFDVLLADQP